MANFRLMIQVVKEYVPEDCAHAYVLHGLQSGTSYELTTQVMEHGSQKSLQLHTCSAPIEERACLHDC